jgi:heme o synthase
MRAYLNLTKPRISLLFAITGLAALVLEGSLLSNPARLWIIVAAIFMTGGSANAFNQYFEREVDSRMERTAKKRPLPLGLITPRAALTFSIVVGIIGTALLWWFGGTLAALLGLGTIAFYSFYYTLWLKPRTPYNIVIGGIAGATAPLIAWAASSGSLAWAPVMMCALIFFWTPPHFWALALCCAEDYKRVGYPMFPLVAGREATQRQILGYSFVLIPVALAVGVCGDLTMAYQGVAGVLSLVFLVFAWRVFRQGIDRRCWQLFGYSILYVLLLFCMMIVDRLWLA